MDVSVDVGDWVQIAVASLAAVAAFMAACAAWKTFRLERFREKNRILLLKHQSEAEHLQKLIASFARVIALGSSQWSHERNQKIDETIQEFQLHVSVLEALNTKISTDITNWSKTHDRHGNSIPQKVHYELGQLHTTIGDKEFFDSKMEGLKGIQDKMYAEMAVK